jgi:hypothetical protein
MAGRVTYDFLEVAALAGSPTARVTSDLLEICLPALSTSGTLTGAGVTSDLLEVALAASGAAVRVTFDALEVCLLDTTALSSGSGPATGGPRAFGWVS